MDNSGYFSFGRRKMAEPADFENVSTPSTLTSPPQRRFAAGSNFLSVIRLASMSGHVKKAYAAMIILAGSLALGGCNTATPGKIVADGNNDLPPVTISILIANLVDSNHFHNEAVFENGEIRAVKSTDYHGNTKINEFLFPVPKGVKEKEVGFLREHNNVALTYLIDKRYLENWECEVHADKPCHAKMTEMSYLDEKGTWQKLTEKKETIDGTNSGK
jgi:hypothetical protein